MTVVALDGVIRHYDWGSTTAIPALLGLDCDGQPAAELWFGAHQDDPSPILGAGTAPGSTLADVIDANPAVMLGQPVLDRFGPRLPFLLKVLAADKALSIQVHPTLDEARSGYAAEDAVGIPRNAPNRNYRDPNHKPELLCALGPFEALCGFRDPAETARLIDTLDVPELDFVRAAMQGHHPLRAAFTAIITRPNGRELSDAVAAEVLRSDEPWLRGVRLAAADFPGDIGVVLALLLNHVVLEAGEAIYLGAGNVHAYLRGVGVEVMANSDNVLRCGLTTKHVDVDELLAITDFSVLSDPRLPAVDGAYDVAVRDFRLIRFELDAHPDGVHLHDEGPLVVLSTAGEAILGEVRLTPGRAAFVPASVTEVGLPLHGSGVVFVAGARA